METLDRLISDLDRLVRTGSRSDRAQTFGRVADLYFSSLDHQQDGHVDFFGDLFGILVDHVDSDTLAALGRRIAPLPRAPAKLIRRLANDDDIAVAAPVIAQSGKLTSDDLAMLARTKGQDHLLAISSRERLDAAVTSVLVERADSKVIKAVAKNPGAEFSVDAYARLAQRSLGDDELAETVGLRPDLPVDVLRAMMSQANEAVRSRIMAGAPPDMKSEIESTLCGIGRSSRNYDQPRKRLVEEHRNRGLDESDVLASAKTRQLEATLVTLEILCNTPVGIIEQFMLQAPAEALPVVCKAAGLSWTATQAVMSLCRQMGRPLSNDERRQASENYSKLTRPTAERLLRFWFVRPPNERGPLGDKTSDPPRVERRRRSQRRPVELPATILLDDKHLLDLIIDDLSLHGARLRVSATDNVPDRFVLALSAGSRISRQCEVRWRRREMIGVQFV
jgi:uncharacterized protein (DUF2336 family)